MKRKIVLLTVDEMVAILEETKKDPVIRAAIHVMANAGLRIGEVCGIKSEHICNFEGHWFIHIPPELAKYKIARSVPISENIAYELLALESIPELPLIRFHPSTIWRRLQKIKESVGLNKHITPHTFRHVAANRWRLMGIPLENIKVWLGHKSLDTTLIYSRSFYDLKQDAPKMPWI